MRSASQLLALKNWSCAIENREPCQVGNQAALSGAFDVPQGRLFRASATVNACGSIVEIWVYDLIYRLSREGVNGVPNSTFQPFLFLYLQVKVRK